jgi:hypothetical protein
MTPSEGDFSQASLELADLLLVNLLYRFPEESVAGARAVARANVHAVGVGEKMTNGQPTGQTALRIHVIQKLPPSLVPPEATLPDKFKGLPTDVIESPVLFRQPALVRRPPQTEGTHLCSAQAGFRQRPLIAGISMASEKVTGGTLGCFCKSIRPDEENNRYALTTGHVLGSLEGGHPGDVVLQPAMGDVATPADRIGTVARFLPIERGRHARNLADAGIALIDPEIAINNSVCGVDPLKGSRPPRRRMQVVKHGRSTQITEGTITDYPIHVVVTLKHADLSLVARFNNQMRIEPSDQLAFAEGGDSGSLIIDKESNQAVGLFFAAPDTGAYAFANPIEAVFKLLEIDLL